MWLIYCTDVSLFINSPRADSCICQFLTSPTFTNRYHCCVCVCVCVCVCGSIGYLPSGPSVFRNRFLHSCCRYICPVLLSSPRMSVCPSVPPFSDTLRCHFVISSYLVNSDSRNAFCSHSHNVVATAHQLITQTAPD
jgi:hypothetical protein